MEQGSQLPMSHSTTAIMYRRNLESKPTETQASFGAVKSTESMVDPELLGYNTRRYKLDILQFSRITIALCRRSAATLSDSSYPKFPATFHQAPLHLEALSREPSPTEESALTQGHQGLVVLLHQIAVELLLPFIQVLPFVLREVDGNVDEGHRDLDQQGF